MKTYHIYDAETFLYKETVEAEEQPANSSEGFLPEETEYYKSAYIDGTWMTVLNPKYEIVDGQLQKIQEPAPEVDNSALIKLQEDRASGKAKLLALGLSEDEIKALIGA
jgi:hypothetical protein